MFYIADDFSLGSKGGNKSISSLGYYLYRFLGIEFKKLDSFLMKNIYGLAVYYKLKTNVRVIFFIFRNHWIVSICLNKVYKNLTYKRCRLFATRSISTL